MSQLWLYNAFLPLLRDHLYSKTTFFGPKRGRLIQVSLYEIGIIKTTLTLFSFEFFFSYNNSCGLMSDTNLDLARGVGGGFDLVSN